MQQGRRLRGSTPSRRSRNRESEGIRFMSNIDLRLLACVELSFKRSNSSSFSSDGIFKLNTASPVIKQSDRVKPRDVIGSGTRLKHLRIARSISGIDRSLRNEFLDILLLNLPGFNVPRSNVKSPRISYKKFTYFLILRLKIDLLGIAAFAIRQPENFFCGANRSLAYSSPLRRFDCRIDKDRVEIPATFRWPLHRAHCNADRSSLLQYPFQLPQARLHQQEDWREPHLSQSSVLRSTCRPLTTMPGMLPALSRSLL